MAFEISALNVNGTKKALERHGLYAEVMAQLSPQAQAIFADPYSARWHDAKSLLAVWHAVKTLRGVELVESLNHEIIRDSIGPVLGPVLKVATALAGASPAALLSRLDQLASAGSRGSRHEWKKTTEKSGVLTITYPGPEPLELMEPIWRGILRVTVDVLGTKVNVESVTEAPGNAFVFQLNW